MELLPIPTRPSSSQNNKSGIIPRKGVSEKAAVAAEEKAILACLDAKLDDKHPSKIWDRTGPLGETPKRTTDAFPLSDQENKGGWVKFEPMTDEFEGKELDRRNGSSAWSGGRAVSPPFSARRTSPCRTASCT